MHLLPRAEIPARIAELLEQKKIPLLDDIHDESAEDIRIVLTPKSRTVEPELLMEQLFRQTDLESRISLNMNVLDKGVVPRVMSLREVLVAFIDHRGEVLERRSKHRLEKIATRLEVLDGRIRSRHASGGRVGRCSIARTQERVQGGAGPRRRRTARRPSSRRSS